MSTLNVIDLNKVINEATGSSEEFVKKPEGTQPPPKRMPLDWEDLNDRVPPDRGWVCKYWIPEGHPALLAGKGGVGKTLIGQHIGTSVALQQEYIAHVPKARKVLMWAGEDDADELWRRQIIINKHFNTPLTALRDRFFLHSYASCDITLAAPAMGALVQAPMLKVLREQVHDYCVELAIIDNSARVFGGNENDRHQVTKFLAWLQNACAPAAVLLLSHPAKATGSEWSGSTAWEGAVRTRLFMSDKPPDEKPVKNGGEDDAIIDTGKRYLSRRKANYSKLDCLEFEMTDSGLLKPARAFDDPYVPEPPDECEMENTVRRAVGQLAKLELVGVTGKSSPHYLPKLAKEYKLFGRLTGAQFGNTMRYMLTCDPPKLVVRASGKYQNRTVKMGVVLP
jgi:hypothetical protein